MGTVYHDIYVAIPYVKGIVIEHSAKARGKKNRVFFDVGRKYDPTKKYAVTTRRITIGYCSDKPGKMHPNKNFAKIFPKEWNLALAKNADIKVDDD